MTDAARSVCSTKHSKKVFSELRNDRVTYRNDLLLNIYFKFVDYELQKLSLTFMGSFSATAFMLSFPASSARDKLTKIYRRFK